MTVMSDNGDISDSSYEDITEEEENLSENEEAGNAAWANSIAKILKSGKPKKKKTLVLSKAKKLNDEKPRNTNTVKFEVQGEDGEIKKEIIETESKVDSIVKKKKIQSTLRVKPNILEKDRERTLSRIATKGVVQLFNAVKTQQKDIDTQLKEAGPLEVKRDKVLKRVDKRSFLDMLMGENNTESGKNTTLEQPKVENDGTWNVLRDDFMMKAKMKDWDKEIEQNMEIEQESD
ncbi:RRP15-like protein [Onthophagus taurus]|uniref:RRP15-like protein n=1 Tax=Onthophagus taurus TaxID=166361 RepID=UPI000C209FFA|nr:RRP15-like protein [Onthophagus taurus]